MKTIITINTSAIDVYIGSSLLVPKTFLASKYLHGVKYLNQSKFLFIFIKNVIIKVVISTATEIDEDIFDIFIDADTAVPMNKNTSCKININNKCHITTKNVNTIN